MEKTNLLNEMSQTIYEQIYNYGKPDNSDYSEYMLIPGERFCQEINVCDETSFLEYLLCWSMFEAVNIHNTQNTVFEQQQELEKKILEKASADNQSIKSVKFNIQLLRYMHENANEYLDLKIQHFISYCLFANKDYMLNGNAYWKQINLVVLEKVYLDSLNINKNRTWTFPSTVFINTANGPISFGPDNTKGPNYSWNDEEKHLETTIYLPMKDQYIKLGCSVNPMTSDISISEACDWVHLDFIIRKEVDKITYPRIYTSNRAMSSRRGIDNLFSLTFGNNTKGKSKEEIESFVICIFNDLLWLWTGEVPKPEFGYIEAKPSLVYCLYKSIRYLSLNSLNNIFNFNKERFLGKEYLKFKELEEKESISNSNPFYLQMSEYYLHNQEKKKVSLLQEINKMDQAELEKKQNELLEEEYSILLMMMFFFLWDIAKNLPAEDFPGEDELLNYFCYAHGDMMEKFYDSFTDETWNKEPLPDSNKRKKLKRMKTTWIDEKLWVELINLILERYKINTRITKINLSNPSFGDIVAKSELLKTLLYYFSETEQKSKDALLNMMDYLGELKDREDLYCQPKQGQKFNSDVPANKEIIRMKDNHSILKKKDCGFEIDKYVQVPVPVGDANLREYNLLRKLTCRFFSDTDKEYKYSIKDNKKNFSIKCNENYRQTNKNNFYCKCLYVSERNTARHYVDAFSVRNILDDTYPVNLLEAFRDAKDFLSELLTLNDNDSSQSLLLKYQLDFLKRHFVTYIEKFNLVKPIKDDEDDLWEKIFTNDKKVRENIKQKLPDYGDYQSVLGKDYLDEVRWFFKLLYCTEPDFMDRYYSSLVAYLTYLGLRLLDFIQ